MRKPRIRTESHPRAMDPVRLGHAYRALRLRRRWRQVDLGANASVSPSAISRLERGRVDEVSVATLRKVAEALEASLDVRLRWNGEGLDRLLDEAHAGHVESLVQRLLTDGWLAEVEVSFAIRGERGSIDVLGYHAPTGMVLVTEVKSVVPDSQATIAGVDRKARLGPEIARSRGWSCRGVGSTARGRRFLDLAASDRGVGHDVSRRFPANGQRGHPLVAGSGRPDGRPPLPPIFTRSARSEGDHRDANGCAVLGRSAGSPIRAWDGNVTTEAAEGVGYWSRGACMGGVRGRGATAVKGRAYGTSSWWRGATAHGPREWQLALAPASWPGSLGRICVFDRSGSLGYAPPASDGIAVRGRPGRLAASPTNTHDPWPGEVNPDWQKFEWVRTRRSKAPCVASTRRSSRVASSPKLAGASTTRSPL
jgi:transcriptional regulator with XRE-family HTH domain